MRKNKNNGEELNDGLLEFGNKKLIKNSLKQIEKEEFVKKGKLFFSIKNCKIDDFKMYFGIDKKVDLKLKTYYMKELKESHIVKIGKCYYDINLIDYDENKQYMYIYLQKRGGLND